MTQHQKRMNANLAAYIWDTHMLINAILEDDLTEERKQEIKKVLIKNMAELESLFHSVR